MLTKKQIKRIEGRIDKATECNPLMDAQAEVARKQLITEDIPRLIAEVGRLEGELREAENIIELAAGIDDVRYEEESRAIAEYLYGRGM